MYVHIVGVIGKAFNSQFFFFFAKFNFNAILIYFRKICPSHSIIKCQNNVQAFLIGTDDICMYICTSTHTFTCPSIHVIIFPFSKQFSFYSSLISQFLPQMFCWVFRFLHHPFLRNVSIKEFCAYKY